MERIDEAGDTQESSRRGAGQVRRAGAQRSQAAGEPGKWPQGRLGQKPQEGHSVAPQCTSAAPYASEELVNRVMMLIRARYGEWAIGRGDRGIRYRAVVQERQAIGTWGVIAEGAVRSGGAIGSALRVRPQAGGVEGSRLHRPAAARAEQTQLRRRFGRHLLR